MLGYNQRRGRDYKKTYASVAALMTVYLTCIVGVVMDFAIHQTDLEAAYLTAPIEPDVEIFLSPPPNIKVPDGMVLHVCKSLYDSMQGAERLDAYKESKLTAKDFIRSCAEPSLYFMPSSSKYGLVLICTVVDDFLITCDERYIEQVKDILRSIWKITDGGPVEWFLNLKFSRDRRNGLLKICQSVYTERKLRQFGLEKASTPKLPMKSSFKLSEDMDPVTKTDKTAMDQIPYRAMTGSLNYFSQDDKA